MMTKKRAAIWICSLALLASWITFPTAFAQEGEFLSDQQTHENMPSQNQENEGTKEETVDADTPDEESASSDPNVLQEPGTDELPDGESEQPAPEKNVYEVSLGSRTIGNGEWLSYETVSPSLAGNPFAEAYYPGELTVEITGQIVVESGGSLVIGTMSEGDPSQTSPVIRGTLLQEGLIVVKAGGSLTLKTVTFDLSGEGLLIVQEPGGAVYLSDTQLDGAMIRWAPPMVDNTYQQPSDLWLEEGTALTEALLPETLKTNLQYQGAQQWIDIPIQWDLSVYGEQSSGELTITGCFLDGDGNVLASSRPLELTIHWYKPDKIVVTDAIWMGETAASAKLQVDVLPDMATDIWGEVSNDGGTTWQRWDDFQIRESDEVIACVFYLPDDTPRYFRICASFISRNYRQYWTSDNILLPEEEGDDSGGDRGGSITPIPPEREPEEPDPPPETQETLLPPETQEPDPVPETQKPVLTPEAQETLPPPQTQKPDLNPETQNTEPTPEPQESDPAPETWVTEPLQETLKTEPTPQTQEPDPTSETNAAPENTGTPPILIQAVIVSAGLSLCILIGFTAARGGIFRKKKGRFLKKK